MKTTKQLLLFVLFLVFAFAQQGIAQERAITGKVTDANGNPILSARIAKKNSSQKPSAVGLSGAYTIFNIHDGDTIIFSAQGFENKEIILRGEEVLNINLEKRPITLGEVKIEVEPEKPEPAKPPKVTQIDDDIIPSPTEKFKPEEAMIEINPLISKKITLKIGQKAYYQATEHGSVGIGVGVVSKNNNILEKADTHFAYHRVQVVGMTGGDRATRTHIFEAKKAGKTKIMIREGFRGETTKKHTVKIIIK